MITILSPAKRLNYSDPVISENYTIPQFIEESQLIMNKLKKLTASGIKKLMNINDLLAETNYDRFQNWKPEFDLLVARQAITTFKGDVYLGLDVKSYSTEDFITAQKNIRILSGLHGILKPLDLIRPYRLEMGTVLKVGRANNLYEFWGDKILNSIINEPAYKQDNTIVNLASQEYFNVVSTKNLNGRVITPVFKEYKNGTYRPVHIFLKKARGYMTSYIVKNKINDPDSLKLFDWKGYEYNDQLSKGDNWVFTRG
jgi:cytoplasmic iron level regulating protein YaaA (DUF328/UPF0246 family)